MTVLQPFKDQSIAVGPVPTLDAADVARAARFGAATLHEAAGRIGALPSEIKPVAPNFRIAGRAFTLSGPPNDNLWLHRAMSVAEPGDVLIAHVSHFYEAGYWGEVMSTAAIAGGLAGLVIDGGVRDVTLLELLGFPIFARRVCISGTGKDFGALGSLAAPVMVGNVVVHAGDLVVGDADGVVVIPNKRVAEVLEKSAKREGYEAGVMERLRAGEKSLDVFGFNR